MPEATAPPPPATPLVATAPAAPATNDAIIVFANTPGTNCGICETAKISLTPGGQVLIERGFWGSASDHSNWRYKRSHEEVGAASAAAFAASLSAVRPVGEALAGCSVVTAEGGLSIEWLEGDRHDRLIVNFGCPVGGDAQLAARLRHAPDLLGLRKLAFPWVPGAK